MSSRQEEKEARRRERLEQEERERKAATRNKRLQLVFGGLLAAGIVAAIVVVVLAGGGGSGGDGSADDPKDPQSVGEVTLPEPAILDEAQAVEAAGCKLTNVDNEGRGHEEKEFTPSDYKSNPPTSGTHFPAAAQDGIYDPGETPPLGTLVHSLEHGRIDVQYAKGTSADMIAKLESFLAENDGYHMLLFENATDMPSAIAATAWDFKLECDDTGDEMWDALRTFRDAHLDRGPEKVA